MSTYKALLRSAGFRSLLWTQFLGAYNGHTYRLLFSLILVATSASKGSKYFSVAGAVSILPFLVFSGYAGHLADVFNKRHVLIATKSLEMLSMALAIPALISHRADVMLVVLFLLAIQAALFSPAKYGILPEMLPDRDLSRANGLLQMSTFLGMVVAMCSAPFLWLSWKQQRWTISGAMLALAIAGTLMSLRIGKVASPVVVKPFALNPFAEVFTGMKRLRRDRPLWLTLIGLFYLWFLGTLCLLEVGREVARFNELQLILIALAMGIVMGSIMAGGLSGDKIELGLVPLGALGIGTSSILLYSPGPSQIGTIVALALWGFCSGLFVVPLNAYLQQRSGVDEKGQCIATSNFLSAIGIVLAFAVLSPLHQAGISSHNIVLAAGIFTLLAAVYCVVVVSDFMVRFLLWLLTHTIFRIRVVGVENVPFRGPALMVANHMSHIDSLLIGPCVQRFIRFVVYRPYYEFKGLRWFFRLTQAIVVAADSPTDVAQSLMKAHHELETGHVVCIFAEGSISRTGNLLPFKSGLEHILEGLDVPVIPVHLDRLWGSIFSFERGRFFWKWPKRVPYPVTVSFGTPRFGAASAQEMRLAIMELGSEAIEHRRTRHDLLHLRFVRTAKRKWFSFAMADSSGKQLSYGQALTGSLLLAKWIRKHCGQRSKIGLLLPNTVGGALANIAVLMAGNTPANLNYTAGKEAMASAIEQCGIRTILTSKLFLAKANLQRMEGMIFLEDMLREFSRWQKVATATAAFLLPTRIIERRCNSGQHGPESLATILFSSGSTGMPKGVMLSHYNVISNIEAVAQVYWINASDRVVGVLPFFHSFGFAHTLWFPLVAGTGVVYHPNPMDAQSIGELVAKHRGTFLLSTPTFCSAYTRKCTAEQFSSLRYVLVGAEKLREPIAKAFYEKFGLRPMEGYGATEMSPVISLNVPDYSAGRERQSGTKPGTVGHPVPGVAAKVVDPDTGQCKPPDQEGLLLVKGPNLMLGYLGQPERTATVIANCWYITGDVACLDDDGFIRLTDRLSRFSKIAGEMVPHLKIEDTIQAILGDFSCAVTGIPDEVKGERLVAFYTKPGLTAWELWQRLAATDLPKLWIPKRENLHFIETLPTLGTGKLDLRELKRLAEQ